MQEPDEDQYPCGVCHGAGRRRVWFGYGELGYEGEKPCETCKGTGWVASIGDTFELS